MATSDLVNLSGLTDVAKCFAFIRQQRWPEGVRCPGYVVLDRLLARLHRRKDELPRVLQHPEIPLHTNGSENDLRTCAIKRKISRRHHEHGWAHGARRPAPACPRQAGRKHDPIAR